jgi:hypothetical protein
MHRRHPFVATARRLLMSCLVAVILSTIGVSSGVAAPFVFQ